MDTAPFWITAVITVGYQLLFFFIASWNKFDKVTDFAGGSNFAINAIVSLVVGGVRPSATFSHHLRII